MTRIDLVLSLLLWYKGGALLAILDHESLRNAVEIDDSLDTLDDLVQRVINHDLFLNVTEK